MAEKSPNVNAAPDFSAAKVEPAKAEPEREVEVELLRDVWIDDPSHPEAEPGGARRIRTNLQVLNEDGSPKVDKKTKTYVTYTVKAKLPVSLAKKLIASGAAVRADDL